VTHRVGVCSWSLCPTGPADLVEKIERTGLRHVQLALDPVRKGEWDEGETRSRLADAGISILSGMIGMIGEDYTSIESIRRTGGIRSDRYWEENLAAAWENAKLASRMELPLVTFHAGFLPSERGDRERKILIERVRAVSDRFAAEGIEIGLETGQESAENLRSVLRELDRPRIGVNFDPANMILYGAGDPVEALAVLAPDLRQIHVKDALPTDRPGTWGRETRAGKGAVDWRAFFDTLRDHNVRCDLVVEREDGNRRVADVKAAAQLVERYSTVRA